MNKLCVQYTPGFADDELRTCLMLNRPCFEFNLSHMAAITERKQCIFFSLSAALILKQNNSSKQHSQLSIALPNASFHSVFFTLLFFLKVVSWFSFKNVHYFSRDVTTPCSGQCSSLFYRFF